MALGAWAGGRPAALDRPLAILVAPGQAIRVWSFAGPAMGYGMVNNPFYRAPRRAARSLWIGVWYENLATGTTIRLIAVTLPAWPLLLLGTSLAGGAVWLWIIRAVMRKRKT